VAESVQRVIWQYDLSVDGEVSGKRELARFEDHGLDGMRCDVAGNLYVTRHGKGTVVVLSPDGQVLREVSLRGQEPTNIAFGGTDGQICYVTVADRGCIEAFRAERPGRSWVMMERRK
jgi:sugar lactone lactonase YvrE